MYWVRYRESRPEDESLCIVATRIHNKMRAEIYTYVYEGDESYWVSKSGNKLKCANSDQWCAVEDIIEDVKDRIIDDMTLMRNIYF